MFLDVKLANKLRFSMYGSNILEDLGGLRLAMFGYLLRNRFGATSD